MVYISIMIGGRIRHFLGIYSGNLPYFYTSIGNLIQYVIEPIFRQLFRGLDGFIEWCKELPETVGNI